MKRVVALSLLAALLLLAIPSSPASARQDPIPRSVVSLHYVDEKDRGIFCTGFVIDTKRRYVMTADHCIQAVLQPQIMQKRAWEVAHIPALDVSIVQADAAWEIPALKMRKEPLVAGLKLRAYGYADGNEPVRRIDGQVVFHSFVFLSNPNYPLFLYRPKAIEGMSGGPIVDEAGKVISVCQQVSDRHDLAISLQPEALWAVTQEWWGPQ